MVFVSCEEDKFTEKDAMEALQTIDVTITVQDGSSHAEAVEGATVKMMGDSASSTTTEKTTDASGNVLFEDMKIGGNITVYVNKDDYTKRSFSVSTSTNSYRDSRISETVKIYPLSGDNMATVEGQLTIETDLTNRKREKLADQEVRVINNSLGSDIEKSFVGTTDEDGKYSIKVPVNADGGDNLEVKVPGKIDTTQTLAMEERKREIVSKPTVYYADDYNPSDIPFVPSAIATIEAPSDVGTGFEMGIEAKGTKFNEHSEIELIQGGSDYHIVNGMDTIIPMSEGVNEDTTWATVEISKTGADSSSITDIYVEPANDNGLYTSEPELDLSVLGGSGAVVDIRFQSEYLVYIENYGSGYKDVPTVSATYKEYDGNTIVKRTDEDLEDWDPDIGDYNELHPFTGSNYRLSNFITLHDGSLYPDKNNAYNGDTLFVTDGFTETPEVNIASSEGQQAEMYISWDDINDNDSTITGYVWNQNGEGYDPENPPEVTITSLAEYGSGAEYYIEVNSDGSIYSSDLEMKDQGEGYVRNVNDYLNSGIDNPHHDWDGHNKPGRGHDFSISGGWGISHVGPGDVNTKDIYYGTGIRQEEE